MNHAPEWASDRGVPRVGAAPWRKLALLLSGSLLLGWLVADRRTPRTSAAAASRGTAGAALASSAEPSTLPSNLPPPQVTAGLRPHKGMARREVFNRFVATVKQAAISWVDDYASSMGAALSYYTLFSIGPLLLIVVSVAGLVFGQDVARAEILAQLDGLMGREGAEAVAGMLKAFERPTSGILGAVIGVGVLLLAATTVFAELQDSLDRIWRAPARQTNGLWTLLRARLLSFGMILTIGFLLIVSLVASAALAAFGRWWDVRFDSWAVMAQGLDLVVSFALMTVAFAMIYKIMPRVRIQWFDVWVGAAATAALFALGKSLIGLYIGRSGVVSGFGAASSIVVLLVWVYYSAQIFLLGAEFTWVFSHTFGSRRGVQDNPVHCAPGVPGRSADAVATVPAEPISARTGTGERNG